jgi:hypothetical protein
MYNQTARNRQANNQGLLGRWFESDPKSQRKWDVPAQWIR